MAIRYAVASGDWSDISNVWSDTDGGSPGNYVPADGDTFVIRAGILIKMDVDQSIFTGLSGENIIRGGVTPGMLYFSNGDDGHLKFRTGATLVGTTDTNRGRLLANSNGSWGVTTALQNSNKAIIDLQGTAQILATNLDIALYCTQPTNEYVHCYGDKFDFDANTDVNITTNVITLDDTSPAEGVDVILVPASGATLPTGLYEDTLYYIRDNSGNTCKLATTNSDDTIIDITAIGNGTIYLLTEQASGTAVLKVLEDVTSDSPWSSVSGHDSVILVDAAPASYDQQRTTILSIDGAAQITLSDNVDSTQYAGTKLYLSSRNVSIRSTGTSSSQSIVLCGLSDTHGGVFQCEISNTTGSGTTFYGNGIYYGSGHTVSGTISGCSHGIYYGSGHTISGTISGCSNGIRYGSGHTISGTISGCYYGIRDGSGYTISGTISGCSYGIYYGFGYTISGTISGCSYGIYYGSGHTISGTISGCSYGIYYGSGHTISGTISGCSYGIRYGSGYTISGTISGCSYSFVFYLFDTTIKSGANIDYSLLYRNQEGGRIRIEDYLQSHGTNKVIDSFGDIIKTACDGTGDAPSVDPDSGNGYCVEASNIQSNISEVNKLIIVPAHRIWLTAEEHTITYKLQTTYAGISAGKLTMTCSYISTESPVTRTITTNAPAISQRSDDTDWSETLAVTITPVVAGWVDIEIKLTEYESGNEVYIWPTPTIS